MFSLHHYRKEISVKIEFIAGVAVVATDPLQSRKLYVDAWAYRSRRRSGTEYYASGDVGGSKHFGVWPLTEVAQACFGTDEWPADLTVPQVTIEFEVADEAAVAAAAEELEGQGFSLLHGARKEPWGQTVARVLSIEGSVIGISYAPWLHE